MSSLGGDNYQPDWKQDSERWLVDNLPILHGLLRGLLFVVLLTLWVITLGFIGDIDDITQG